MRRNDIKSIHLAVTPAHAGVSQETQTLTLNEYKSRYLEIRSRILNSACTHDVYANGVLDRSPGFSPAFWDEPRATNPVDYHTPTG